MILFEDAIMGITYQVVINEYLDSTLSADNDYGDGTRYGYGCGNGNGYGIGNNGDSTGDGEGQGSVAFFASYKLA